MTSSKETLDGVSVKKEDQGRINRFARKNALLQELRDELKGKRDILQDIEEAEGNLMMTDETLISYRVGEVFFQLTLDSTQSMLGLRRSYCI